MIVRDHDPMWMNDVSYALGATPLRPGAWAQPIGCGCP